MGAFEGPYDFRSRMGDGKGTNPEGLLGAAHAGCFSMALVLQLTNAGFTVQRTHTTAKVHFEERDGGRSIHRIDLDTEASVSDIAAAAFEEQAQNRVISRTSLPDEVRVLGKEAPSPCASWPD